MITSTFEKSANYDQHNKSLKRMCIRLTRETERTEWYRGRLSSLIYVRDFILTLFDRDVLRGRLPATFLAVNGLLILSYLIT